MIRAAPGLPLLLALPLALALACHREPELASGHVAVHDARGELVRELRATSYGFFVRPSGLRIRVGPDLVDAGAVRIEGGRLLGEGRARASIEESPGRVALYDPLRAPLGQLVEKAGEVWVYDPGGTPLGRSRADGDRALLVGRDGEARGFVVGLPPRAAAALLLAPLPELERDLLAIWLGRR